MQKSKKIIAATTSLLAAGSLTTVVAIGAGGSADASTVKQTTQAKRTILRFNDFSDRERGYGNNRFASTGIDRRNGNVIGYSALHGRIVDDEYTVWGTFTNRGGIIYCEFIADGENDGYSGEVTGGVGLYEDAEGSCFAQASLDDDGSTSIRINWSN